MIDPRSAFIIRRERRWRLFSFLAILLTAAAIVVLINGLLASCVLAFVIAYLCAPIVDFLEREGLRRSTATLIPFLAGGTLVVIGTILILPLITEQLEVLISQLPRYQRDLTSLISSIEARYGVYLSTGQINLSQNINHWIIGRTGDLSVALPSILSQSFTVLLLAPFFAFFMLKDGNAVARSMLAFVPNQFFEIALNLRHQINEQLGGFIRARFLEAAIVGAVVWIGLQIIGFPYATVLAIFAAVTNLIPYLGPIIGAVPAVLIALVSQEASIDTTPTVTLLLVSSIYLLAQLIDIVFVIPLVVARIVDLHPVTVVVMIIAGAEVAGILGMVIAIPVASAVKLTFNALYLHLTNFRD
ncbi:MAG: AI-2E family transporter [Bdellovibrionales bacterium]|jgi:putative permease|nr:AI-2E family transporter [Bdellovibrionales bacterium]